MKLLSHLFPLQTNVTHFIRHLCKTSPLRIPRQSYSTNNTTPPRAGRVRLKTRRLLHVYGRCAAEFLQGHLTSNVYLQPAGCLDPESNRYLKTGGRTRKQSFYSTVLNARGRVINDVFVYPISPITQDLTQQFGAGNLGYGESWLIEADAYYASTLLNYLRKYNLRTQVQIRLLDPDEAEIWSVWDDDHGVWPNVARLPHISCLDNRAPGFGKRVIVPSYNTEVHLFLVPNDPDSSIPETTEKNYKIRRYLHGIPEGQKEIIRQSYTALESNLDHMGAIDFDKGCYVGQELTIRTRHRGVIRKRILPLMLYREGEAPPKTLEYKEDGLGELVKEDIQKGVIHIRKVGDRTNKASATWSDGVGNLALGMVRVGMMTPMTVPGEEEDEHQYQEGDEFEFSEFDGFGFFLNPQTQPSIRVKAFIPPWLEERIIGNR